MRSRRAQQVQDYEQEISSSRKALLNKVVGVAYRSNAGFLAGIIALVCLSYLRNESFRSHILLVDLQLALLSPDQQVLIQRHCRSPRGA